MSKNTGPIIDGFIPQGGMSLSNPWVDESIKKGRKHQDKWMDMQYIYIYIQMMEKIKNDK